MFCPYCGTRNDETNITCIFQGCRKPLPPAESFEANARILLREIMRAVGQRNPRGLLLIAKDPNNPVTQAAITLLVWAGSRGIVVALLPALIGDIVAGPVGLIIPSLLFYVYRRYQPTIRQRILAGKAAKYCTQCGRPAGADHQYCHHCGARLTAPVKPAAPA
jgi:hypothetical protein